MSSILWKARLNRLMLGLLHCAIVGGALAGVMGMQRIQLHQGDGMKLSLQQLDRQEAIRLDVLQHSPTFGFDNLLADWAFLNFVQYDGDEAARKQLGYGLAAQYFDVITRLDPRFVDSYLFLSGTLSYQLGEPELAAKYFKRGTEALTPQAHPRASLPWRLQGLDQLLLLGDVPGAIRSNDIAGDWALQSSLPEIRHSGPILKGIANFLRSEPDSARVRFWAWNSVYFQAMATRDRVTQERAKRELLALGGIEKNSPEGIVYFELPEAEKKAPAKQPETSSQSPSPQASPQPSSASSPSIDPAAPKP